MRLTTCDAHVLTFQLPPVQQQQITMSINFSLDLSSRFDTRPLAVVAKHTKTVLHLAIMYLLQFSEVKKKRK